MKILICTNTFEKRTNGTAHFPNLALKINELYSLHEIRVVTPDAAQSYDKVIKVVFNYPRIFHAFYTLLCNLSYYKALKKIQKDYNFDIVVFNHAANGVWSKWFLPPSIKVFGLIHDDTSLKMRSFNYESFRHRAISYLKKGLEIRAIKDLDIIFCPSTYIQDMLLQKFKTVDFKIKLLYQTIDIEGIKYQKKDFDAQKVIKILFIKFDYLIGGLLDLIDALGLLQNYQFQLTVVGTAQSSTDNTKARANFFPNIVLNMLYYCPPQKISELMQEHHVLCIPSRAESLGLANVEGLAHGIPVVTTCVGGIPEVLDHGKNGWLAEPNNALSLSQILKDCIELPSLRLEKSIAGRKFIEQQFDCKNMIHQFIQICENMNYGA